MAELAHITYVSHVSHPFSDPNSSVYQDLQSHAPFPVLPKTISSMAKITVPIL